MRAIFLSATATTGLVLTAICRYASAEAFNDVYEWVRYGFDEQEEGELGAGISTQAQEAKGLNLTPRVRDRPRESKNFSRITARAGRPDH